MNMGKSLRKQLIDARDDLRHQIDVLRSPATVAGKGGLMPPDNRTLIAELERQLREINEAIANLDSDNA